MHVCVRVHVHTFGVATGQLRLAWGLGSEVEIMTILAAGVDS